MVTKNQILLYLTSNKPRFEEEYHLSKIGIFGSIARGEQTSSSDIDIIVEFEENTADLFSLKQKLKSEIQSKFKTSVDICREKYITPIFRKQILSETIYA